MKIVFMGTSDFAIPALQKIIQSDNTLVGIVTKPDRPRGRGGQISPTPVKKIALDYNIPLMETPRIKAPDSILQVQNMKPDLIVVVSFGQIIPADLLFFPPAGTINLHPSLLPHYRGPAPIQRVLMAGEEKTGVTAMYLDEGLDTGDIILQKEVNIPAVCDYGGLEKLLAEAGADLLIETIDLIGSGTVPRKTQDEAEATYAPLITVEDEKIDWSRSAWEITNRVRGLSPSPGAYASFNQTRFKIYQVRVLNTTESGEPGQIKEITSEGLAVYTGQGIVELLEVQRQGKKRMPCKAFLQGFRINPGDRLDL